MQETRECIVLKARCRRSDAQPREERQAELSTLGYCYTLLMMKTPPVQ